MRLKQAVLIEPTSQTGQFAGLTIAGRAIVILDRPTENNIAIIMPLQAVKELNCHWCLDKKKVPACGSTLEQEVTNTIPVVDCPHCI
jgi:hypothetical protein